MSTKEMRGWLNGHKMRIGIVVARFNELISKELLAGALDALERHNVASGDIVIIWVPGAFEVPLAAQRLSVKGKFDAIICLGAIIRGETSHFDYVAAEAASGIARVAQEQEIPVLFGVLTCDTVEQAQERSGGKEGNKGFECAVAAIEMVDLMKRLENF